MFIFINFDIITRWQGGVICRSSHVTFFCFFGLIEMCDLFRCHALVTIKGMCSSMWVLVLPLSLLHPSTLRNTLHLSQNNVHQQILAAIKLIGTPIFPLLTFLRPWLCNKRSFWYVEGANIHWVRHSHACTWMLAECQLWHVCESLLPLRHDEWMGP